MPGTVFTPLGNFPVPDGKKPEDQRKEFYQLVGQCVKAWASVEEWLFRLCLLALNAPEKQTAIIYYRTPTIDSRLTLTSELLACILPAPERKDGGHDHPDMATWKKLAKDIRDLLPVRNLIAHAPVKEETRLQSYPGPGILGILFNELLIEVALSDTEKLRDRKFDIEQIAATELPDHFGAIEAITSRLKGFYDHLKAGRP